jgi:hypothetical protein
LPRFALDHFQRGSNARRINILTRGKVLLKVRKLVSYECAIVSDDGVSLGPVKGADDILAFAIDDKATIGSLAKSDRL